MNFAFWIRKNRLYSRRVVTRFIWIECVFLTFENGALCVSMKWNLNAINTNYEQRVNAISISLSRMRN